MGICFKNTGQFDEAIKIFDKAISVQDKDESGHFNKAICYFKIIDKISKKDFGNVRNQMINSSKAEF